MTEKHKGQNNKPALFKTGVISTEGLSVCTNGAGWVCNASEGAVVVLNG